MTKLHRLGAQVCFLTVLEAGSPRSRRRQDRLPWGLALGSQVPFPPGVLACLSRALYASVSCPFLWGQRSYRIMAQPGDLTLP